MAVFDSPTDHSFNVIISSTQSPRSHLQIGERAQELSTRLRRSAVRALRDNRSDVSHLHSQLTFSDGLVNAPFQIAHTNGHDLLVMQA